MEYYLKNVRPLLHVVGLLLIGTFMIIDPHSMDVANPVGAKAVFKDFLSHIWSVPVGIGLICVSLFLGYRHFNKKSNSTPE